MASGLLLSMFSISWINDHKYRRANMKYDLLRSLWDKLLLSMLRISWINDHKYRRANVKYDLTRILWDKLLTYILNDTFIIVCREFVGQITKLIKDKR